MQEMQDTRDTRVWSLGQKDSPEEGMATHSSIFAWRSPGCDGWMASLSHGHELEQTLGDGEGQGCLVCCSPWGCKEVDTTEWLKNNNDQVHIPLQPNPIKCGFLEGRFQGQGLLFFSDPRMTPPSYLNSMFSSESYLPATWAVNLLLIALHQNVP